MFGWMKRGRMKKLVLSLGFAIAMFSATNAKADFSKNTQNLESQVVRMHQVMKSKKEISKDDRSSVVSATRKLVKSIEQDMGNDFADPKKYPDALKKYKVYVKYIKALKKWGGLDDELRTNATQMASTIKFIKRQIKKQGEPEKCYGPQCNIPVGTYTIGGPGLNFKLEMQVVSDKAGRTEGVFRIWGSPLGGAAEWKRAIKGKPDNLVKFIESGMKKERPGFYKAIKGGSMVVAKR